MVLDEEESGLAYSQKLFAIDRHDSVPPIVRSIPSINARGMPINETRERLTYDRLKNMKLGEWFWRVCNIQNIIKGGENTSLFDRQDQLLNT